LKDLSHIKAVYFLGIGGIGMSALARYFHLRGLPVAGYDRTPSALTQELEHEGMSIHYQDDITAIPMSIRSLPPELLLVVLTPAVSSDHTELLYFLDQGYSVFKRSEVLGLITRQTSTIAVAGTHGKTTTSAMVTHLLEATGKQPTAFVGGIMTNYDTNFLPGVGNLTVVEADEFDRSFLRLSPDISIITSVDPDHLDIYSDASSFTDGFRLFAKCLKSEGKLIVHESVASEFAGISRISYGFGDEADVQIYDIRVGNGTFLFSVKGLYSQADFVLHIPGRHNVLNAVAAVTACWLSGLPPEDLRLALASFRGVKRRFEKIAEHNGKVFIDDYAHHPSELEACISAARELYPDKRIFGAFQPHLFTRTRDFSAGFSAALNKLDYFYLLPIYPARELPIPGVSSQMLLADITAPGRLINKEDLADAVRKDLNRLDVFLTLGAGDIDREVERIKKEFEA
jgi:UDP-N-acetylmuramate--alanine ligase